MGRTNPTYRDLLSGLEEEWQPFRRGLRFRDQERFDRLFADASTHADAAGYLNPTDPLDPALVGMLIEQQRRLDALIRRVETLEAAVDAPTGDLDPQHFDIDQAVPSGGGVMPPDGE